MGWFGLGGKESNKQSTKISTKTTTTYDTRNLAASDGSNTAGGDLTMLDGGAVKEAFDFATENAERVDNNALIAYNRSVDTFDKVVDGIIGNQDRLGKQAYDVQQYAMATLAGSKGVSPAPMQIDYTKLLIYAGLAVVGIVAASRYKIR